MKDEDTMRKLLQEMAADNAGMILLSDQLNSDTRQHLEQQLRLLEDLGLAQTLSRPDCARITFNGYEFLSSGHHFFATVNNG